MAEKKKKLNDILEGYKPIPMKRLFYPRGMKLSEDFVNAFHREYDRLVSEGLNPKTLIERVGKAMSFHVNDTRKYKLLDEEKEKAAQELEEKMKFDGNSGTYFKDTGKPFGGKTRKKMSEKELRADVEDIEDDDHEGDRGEAKRTGKRKKTTKFGKQLKKWADDDS